MAARGETILTNPGTKNNERRPNSARACRLGRPLSRDSLLKFTLTPCRIVAMLSIVTGSEPQIGRSCLALTAAVLSLDFLRYGIL